MVDVHCLGPHELERFLLRRRANNTLPTDMSLAENLQEPEKTVAIRTADVARIVPSDLSPMPTGLLVMLKRDEILDLVAFVAAKGDPAHAAFGK